MEMFWEQVFSLKIEDNDLLAYKWEFLTLAPSLMEHNFINVVSVTQGQIA